MDSQEDQGEYFDSYGDQEMDNFYLEELNMPISLNSHQSDFSEPPVLASNFSGISNTSSNQQYCFASYNTDCCPLETIIFLKPEQLYDKSIARLIEETNETLVLHTDLTLFLLYRYKWSRDRINDEYFDLAAIYLQKNAMILESLEFDQEKIDECQVCCEKRNLLKSTFCKHWYCESCWKGYVKEQLKQGQIFSSCIGKCPISPVLPHVFISKYLPQLLQPYLKQICINYAVINKEISYCPSTLNQNCELFCEQPFSLTMSSSSMVNWIECLCGECYCFNCRKEPHFPLSCQDIAKWNQVINFQEGSIEWIHKNTKKCPKCKVSVEKYIGCSYIKCVCGAQFCYNCNRNWDQFHKDHRGQCNLILKKKSSLEQRTSTQVFLELQEKLMAINRTMIKNKRTVENIIKFLEEIHEMEGWAIDRLKQIRKQVKECWWIYKWSLIGLFIYKKEPVSDLIQDDFTESITSLMGLLQRIEKIGKKIENKELLIMKNDLSSKKQQMRSNRNIWLDAWRSC